MALAARGEFDAVIELLRPLRAVAESMEIGDTSAHATIFALRRGAVLPLHDHPSMTVVSKVLHGRIRMESLEWVDRDGGTARHLGAREVSEESEPSLERDMLHRMAALTDCALLDVFAPYYDDQRPCRYYRILERRGAGIVVLTPI